MRPNNILVNHDYEALVRIQIYMLQNQQHIDPFQWPEWLKLGQLVWSIGSSWMLPYDQPST